jgi:hypothetical protein
MSPLKSADSFDLLPGAQIKPKNLLNHSTWLAFV